VTTREGTRPSPARTTRWQVRTLPNHDCLVITSLRGHDPEPAEDVAPEVGDVVERQATRRPRLETRRNDVEPTTNDCPETVDYRGKRTLNLGAGVAARFYVTIVQTDGDVCAFEVAPPLVTRIGEIGWENQGEGGERVWKAASDAVAAAMPSLEQWDELAAWAIEGSEDGPGPVHLKASRVARDAGDEEPRS
jgi:hypothetical protein